MVCSTNYHAYLHVHTPYTPYLHVRVRTQEFGEFVMDRKVCVLHEAPCATIVALAKASASAARKVCVCGGVGVGGSGEVV